MNSPFFGIKNSSHFVKNGCCFQYNSNQAYNLVSRTKGCSPVPRTPEKAADGLKMPKFVYSTTHTHGQPDSKIGERQPELAKPTTELHPEKTEMSGI